MNSMNDHGFQVYKHCPRHMLASACLTEEHVEGVIYSLQWSYHLAIRLDAMFQSVEFLAGSANLDTSLANMDGEALMHCCCFAAAEQTGKRKERGCCFLQCNS